MIKMLHPVAGIIAFFTILAFWTSSVAAELSGVEAWIAVVKRDILWGLLLLIPCMAITGSTGFRLGGTSPSPVVARKRRRMPLIALNGLIVLLPCAVILHLRASAGLFDLTFGIVQAVELIAGALNLTLIGLNIRDGFKRTGRFRRKASAT